jgi:hypothetical protein
MNKLFTPSSTLLLNMIASAEAKFAGDREQAALRKEAREERRILRAISRAARGRYYNAIQRGYCS